MQGPGCTNKHAVGRSEQPGGTAIAKTIRQLREERGESTIKLAKVLGATLQEVHDLETGVARPSVERLRRLTEHLGVDETDFNLEPQRSPTLGEQIRDALTK
jgi:transcriptional regulator with XRE-family HTH domain